MSAKKKLPGFSVINILFSPINDRLQGPFKPLSISSNFGSLLSEIENLTIKIIDNMIIFSFY